MFSLSHSQFCKFKNMLQTMPLHKYLCLKTRTTFYITEIQSLHARNLTSIHYQNFPIFPNNVVYHCLISSQNSTAIYCTLAQSYNETNLYKNHYYFQNSTNNKATKKNSVLLCNCFHA